MLRSDAGSDTTRDAGFVESDAGLEAPRLVYPTAPVFTNATVTVQFDAPAGRHVEVVANGAVVLRLGVPFTAVLDTRAFPEGALAIHGRLAENVALRSAELLVTVDRTPPAVVMQRPEAGAVGLSWRAPVTWLVNEPLLRASITSGSVRFAEGTSTLTAVPDLSSEGTLVSLRLSAKPALPTTAFAEIDGVTDLAGNALRVARTALTWARYAQLPPLALTSPTVHLQVTSTNAPLVFVGTPIMVAGQDAGVRRHSIFTFVDGGWSDHLQTGVDPSWHVLGAAVENYPGGSIVTAFHAGKIPQRDGGLESRIVLLARAPDASAWRDGGVQLAPFEPWHRAYVQGHMSSGTATPCVTFADSNGALSRVGSLSFFGGQPPRVVQLPGSEWRPGGRRACDELLGLLPAVTTGAHVAYAESWGSTMALSRGADARNVHRIAEFSGGRNDYQVLVLHGPPNAKVLSWEEYFVWWDNNITVANVYPLYVTAPSDPIDDVYFRGDALPTGAPRRGFVATRRNGLVEVREYEVRGSPATLSPVGDVVLSFDSAQFELAAFDVRAFDGQSEQLRTALLLRSNSAPFVARVFVPND